MLTTSLCVFAIEDIDIDESATYIHTGTYIIYKVWLLQFQCFSYGEVISGNLFTSFCYC